MFGRRRRRYPSLQPSSISLRQREQKNRQGPPFALHTTRRRPTTTSPRPTSSLDLEAHVDSAHCNRPRTEKCVMGPICNSFSVMTVCNPPL
jgi:hypothetical protein